MLTELNSAFQVLESIGSTSSLKEKQSILESHSNNQVLRALLYSAYNPYIQYYIKKTPKVNPDCKPNSLDRYASFLVLLSNLSKRVITGNEALDDVKSLFLSLSADEYKWFNRVLKKDLEIGLADKGINKALNNLIPVYEVMLADKIDPEDLNLDTARALKVLPSEFVCQYKIDGYRLNIHHKLNGHVELRTRKGKIITGYNALEQEVRDKYPKGYVYDGEIVAPELFNWISENQKNNKSSQVIANRDLFSEAMSHAFRKTDNKKGIFNIFDMVSESEWVKGLGYEPLSSRNGRILKSFNGVELTESTVVPTSRVYMKSSTSDLQEVVKLFHDYLSVGWEGLMIKDWNSPYEFKRTKSLLKMKMMDTIDLVVTDVFEGEGKYSGAMGGVLVDFKGSSVGVGSGWSDSQRVRYWNSPNDIIGKTIEISYQAESKNKDGTPSLSFPVFKGIREDK